MDSYLLYYVSFGFGSLGPLLAIVVAWKVRRLTQDRAAVTVLAGAILLAFAHLLFYWWNVPGSGSFVDGRSYELALVVQVVQFASSVVGQVLLFGGLLGYLRERHPGLAVLSEGPSPSP